MFIGKSNSEMICGSADEADSWSSDLRMSVEAAREIFESERASAAVRKRRGSTLNVQVKRVVSADATEKEREEKT
jgi:hypothetical protein